MSQSAPSLYSAGSTISASSGSLRPPKIPDDLRAVSRFDLTDSFVMTIRPKLQDDGLVPKLKFEPVRNYAMWVPGSQAYTTYKPVFVLEPPEDPKKWD